MRLSESLEFIDVGHGSFDVRVRENVTGFLRGGVVLMVLNQRLRL